MDLIDRYLDTVRLFLPRDQRDDIAAELRDVLMTRQEEQEAQLGRPLTRKEQEALLQGYGHPLMVAARYGRQQYLIGPDLYPVYGFVVALVLACIALAATIAGVVATTVSGGNVGHGVGVAMGVIWGGGFTGIGAVTAIFALLQRSGASARITVDWSVRDLPRITRRRPRQPWYEHVAGIVFLTLFCFWWVGLIRLWAPVIPLKTGGALQFAFAPELHGLYLPVLALAAGGIAVDALMLAGREVRSISRALDAVLQVSMLVVSGLALQAGRWVAVSGVGVSSAVAAKVEHGVGIGAEVTLIVLICTALGRLGYALWRLARPEAEAGLRANGA